MLQTRLKYALQIVIVLIYVLPLHFLAQQFDSIAIKDHLLTIRAQGIAFLGSGITENDAKIIAINDAKRKALEHTESFEGKRRGF